MRLETKAHLLDIQRATQALRRFTDGKSLDDYLEDELLRSAVERQLEIVGEAVNRLAKGDLESASRIREFRKIISFRNVLIHGYDSVVDAVVWGVVESRLSALEQDVETLLQAD